MNKINFIYLKLCEKYGGIIYLSREIRTYYDAYPNTDNVWEVQQTLGIDLGPIRFYKFENGQMVKIDLKKEQEDGTFEN